MKIAVLGAGISGLGAAYLLSQKHEVDLYEKEDRLGGHARTTQIEENGQTFGVDTGFLVFNHETYPLLTKLFQKLDVKIENSDMSFGFWDKKTNKAYNAQTLGGLFFQKKNLFSLNHYKMIYDIIRFNKKANYDVDNATSELDKSLGEYLTPYGKTFKEQYILPMGAAIWSTPSDEMHNFPAKTFLQFFKNHGLLGVSTQHQWLTVSNGSVNYVNKIKEHVSGKIILNSDVISITRHEEGVVLHHENGETSEYDKVVLAMHAPDALSMLNDASTDEYQTLSQFTYKENDAVLHNDEKALYPKQEIYAAWNYKNNEDNSAVTLSYWINRLQKLPTKKNYFVSLNETENIDHMIERIAYEHPQFNAEAIEAQSKKWLISGVNHTYYAGAYWRYGFHEDGLWSANDVAKEFGCEL
ncbi:MAG: COG2907: Amine oxidase, flavin-containing [uncultured Sulfurovum sp.]|uniref:COG2907: Amine oxidase, flavin-containing n=1 Tax=uncultured Sulfurovum sp. TaxID=269237 RepID=A0A6S6SG42_9BACT|nr:MAG: COG2907: Amine oxidase, flavin-containing [uncultured Sulfurovum sp.]